MSTVPHQAPTSAIRTSRLDAATLVAFPEVQCVEDGCTAKTPLQYEVLGDPASGPWHVPLCEKHRSRVALGRFYPAAADEVVDEAKR